MTVTKTLQQLAADKAETNGDEPTRVALVDTPHSYESNLRLPVDSIVPNPANPRRDASPDDGLVESIKQLGLIEPLVVRPLPAETGGGQRFELLAGHRRLAAVKAAGYTRVPCVYRHVDDAGALEVMLVENLSRKDLAPMEQAAGIANLAKLGRTQRQLAELLGVSQPVISKRLALLKLPEVAQRAVDSGGITLEDAVELSKLPEKTILKLCKDGVPTRWQVQEAANNLAREERRRKNTAQLAKDGVTIVEGRPGWNRSHPPCRVEHLDLPDGVDHTSEPCRGVWVDDYSGHPVECCTDPTRHPEPDKTVVYDGHEMSVADPADRASLETAEMARRKSLRDQRNVDRERRREFCRGLVEKAPISQRWTEVFGLAAMVLPCMSDAALTGVIDLLGLGEEVDWEDMIHVTQKFALEADHGSIRLVYAMALDLGNDLVWIENSDDVGARAFLAHLRDHHYELSETEQGLLAPPVPEDATPEAPVTEDVAVAPVVTVARPARAKKWTVTCTACGEVGKNTTEPYAKEARTLHLVNVHGIEP
jgi:ParB/RepB/Spo0J family partition protein